MIFNTAVVIVLTVALFAQLVLDLVHQAPAWRTTSDWVLLVGVIVAIAYRRRDPTE